jgi:hypothetical protein
VVWITRPLELTLVLITDFQGGLGRSVEVAVTASNSGQPTGEQAPDCRPPIALVLHGVDGEQRGARLSASGPNQLDMSAGGGDEDLEFLAVQGDDLVTVGGQQHHGGVDHVRGRCGSEELAGAAPQRLVEWADIDPLERLRKPGLTGTTAPDLAEHPTVGHWQLAG